MVETVRGALRGIVERERITVLVNPDDLELVRDAMDELRASLGGIEHCEVQAERRVGRGGCVVRTPDGDVDARIETKLERAREVVEAALGRRAGVIARPRRPRPRAAPARRRPAPPPRPRAST